MHACARRLQLRALACMTLVAAAAVAPRAASAGATSTSTDIQQPTPPSPGTIVPLPQCQERRDGAASVLSKATVVALGPGADNATRFAAKWLLDGLQTLCGDDVKPAASLGPPVVMGGPEDPRIKALLASRNLQLSEHLGSEGYILDIDVDAKAVLLAAPNATGLFHGAQTLLQLAKAATARQPAHDQYECTASVQPTRIEDFPDAPMRGVYMYGGWYDNFNRSFLTATIDRMAMYKMSFGIFDGSGGRHFFYAMMNRTASGGLDPAGDSLYQNFSFFKAFMEARHIEFIPNLSAGSGGVSDVVNANLAEGLWMRDELFEFTETNAVPVESPAMPFPYNANFSNGMDGWTPLGHGSPPLMARAPNETPLCWHNATFGPSSGLGSVGCRSAASMLKVPHTRTVGIRSSSFPTVKGGKYAWSVSVFTANITCALSRTPSMPSLPGHPSTRVRTHTDPRARELCRCLPLARGQPPTPWQCSHPRDRVQTSREPTGSRSRLPRTPQYQGAAVICTEAPAAICTTAPRLLLCTVSIGP